MPVKRPPRSLVHAVVFFASFAVMSLELAASRLLMPHHGSSIFVWGSLISVILVALAVGYVIGGRAADRHDPAKVLGWLLVGAAAWVALADLVAPLLLAKSSSLGIVGGTLVAVSLLFLAPMAALGAMTPAVLKLRVDDTATLGATSGNIFFLSSIGSVLGTLATSFLLVPFAGTVLTIALVAGILGVLGVAVLAGSRLRAAVAVVPLVTLSLVVPPALVAPLPGELHAVESPYQYVRVVEQGGLRFLLLNADRPFESFNSVRGPTALSGYCFDDLALAPALVPEARRVLVLGLGSGTVAGILLDAYPRLEIDGVELDPAVVEAGQRYFGLQPGPRLRVHVGGARAFVGASDQKWDVIIVDAYQNGAYIPFHLATREFYALLAEHLAPGGVVAVNIELVEEPLLNTIGVTFPHLRTVRRGGNLVTFASRHPLDLPPASSPRVPDALRAVMERATSLGELRIPAPEPIFTDDRAPVELEVALRTQ